MTARGRAAGEGIGAGQGCVPRAQPWPRGVKKTAVDRWYRELGAPRALIRPYLDGEVSWEEFRAAVWEALHTPAAQEALKELAEEIRRGRRVTLLTSVRDMAKTHLEIIADALRECMEGNTE